MPRVVVDGRDEGGDLSFEDGPVTLGRDAGRHLVFADSGLVSGHHASIGLESGAWILRDHESPHGTFVNGRRIREQLLRDGDVVELGLGGPRLRFVAADDGPAGTAAETGETVPSSPADPASRPVTAARPRPAKGPAAGPPAPEPRREGAGSALRALLALLVLGVVVALVWWTVG